jgi:hypothetical protein
LFKNDLRLAAVKGWEKLLELFYSLPCPEVKDGQGFFVEYGVCGKSALVGLVNPGSKGVEKVLLVFQ